MAKGHPKTQVFVKLLHSKIKSINFVQNKMMMLNACQPLREEIIVTLENIHSVISAAQPKDDSILSGNLGLMFYYRSRAHLLGDELQMRHAVNILETVLDKVVNSESTLRSYQYASGLSGLGFAIESLRASEVIDFDFDENFESIDELIFNTALSQIKDGYVEYLHGGMGALHYFVSRQKSDKMFSYKSQLVDALLTEVAKDPIGVRIPRSKYFWNSNDDYDLSLSHGLCGVLHILLTMIQKDGREKWLTLESYLEKAGKFVSELKRNAKPEFQVFSFFPSYLSRNASSSDLEKITLWPESRLGWCYGDIGWVHFFYRLGIYFNEPNYLKLADEVGKHSTTRKTFHQTQSSTSHFCHGHAGLAIYYLELFNITQNSMYKTTSHFWLRQTLDQVKIELDNGFYKKENLEHSFLEGLVGIALTLSAFIADDKSEWRSALLL